MKEIHLLDIEKGEMAYQQVQAKFTAVGVGEVYLVPETVYLVCSRESIQEHFNGLEAKERTKEIKDLETLIMKTWGADQWKKLMEQLKKPDLETKPELPRADCSNCPFSTYPEYPVEIPTNSDFFIDCVRHPKRLVEIIAFQHAQRVAREKYGCAWIEATQVGTWRTVSELLVYPYAEELHMDVDKVVDELGREYRKKVVYYLGDKGSTAQSFMGLGTVMPNPKTQVATLLITEITPLHTAPVDVKPTKIPLVELEQRVGALSSITGIHGRNDAHLLILLNYASPMYFYFNNQPVEGWGKIAFVGETTTGKGQTATKLRRELKLGGLAVGESASRAGLLYGVENLGSTHALVWGLIPQYNGQHLIIDGCNGLSRQDWRSCREAIRAGMVRVQKITGGTHPSRTRLLLIGNPRHSLSSYRNKIDAIHDIFEAPDIARLDLVLMFAVDDVPPEVVNQPAPPRQAKLLNSFKDNIAFAWHCKAKNITFSNEATQVILDGAGELMAEFGAGDIPLVGNDTKNKLARLSVEVALLCGGTTIELEHVKFARNLIKRLYTDSGLDKHAKLEKSTAEQEAKEAIILADWLKKEMKDEVTRRLVQEIFIPNQVLLLKEIVTKLGKAENTVRQRVNELVDKKLVVRTKQGIVPTHLYWEVRKRLV